MERFNAHAKEVEQLIDMLNSKDWKERATAVTGLSEAGDERVVEALISALHDKDHRVAWQAAQKLGLLGDKRAVEPLIRELEKSQYRTVRCSSAEALGRIGDEGAIEPLVTALGIGDSQLCDYVAAALSKLGSGAISPLLKALKSEKDLVRADAAYCLGVVGDVRAVQPLIETLKDKNDEVLCCAIIALGKIGDITSIPFLTGIQHNQTYVPKLGVSLGDSASEAIEKIRHKQKFN